MTEAQYEVTARIRCVSPEKIEAARIGLRKLVIDTLTEPGCREFSIHEDVAAPGDFLMWEVFSDEAAFKQHFEYPHTKEYVEKGLTTLLEHWISRPL